MLENQDKIWFYPLILGVCNEITDKTINYSDE